MYHQLLLQQIYSAKLALLISIYYRWDITQIYIFAIPTRFSFYFLEWNLIQNE